MPDTIRCTNQDQCTAGHRKVKRKSFVKLLVLKELTNASCDTENADPYPFVLGSNVIAEQGLTPTLNYFYIVEVIEGHNLTIELPST
jgi:hypothetical protein